MSCPRCHEAITEADARFCPACGASLAAGAPSPAPAGPRCQVHPSVEAREICSRCGAFACDACLTRDDLFQPLCSRCAALVPACWRVPWERREQLGMLSAWAQTMRATVFTPGTSLCRLRPVQHQWWDPLTYAALSALLFPASLAVVGAFVAVIALLATQEPAALGALIQGIAAGLISAPLLVLIRALALAAGEHLVLRLLSGTRQPFEATLRVCCYASGPTVFWIVPSCGAPVAEIWQMILRGKGYRSVHGLNAGQAVAAVLLPTLTLLLGAGALWAFLK